MRLSGVAMPQGRELAAAVAVVLIALLAHAQAPAADGPLFGANDYLQHPNAPELWEGWSDKGDLFWSEPPGPLALTIDYLVRPMFDSYTSYQFGSAPSEIGSGPGQIAAPYAPESKLDWSLNSVWTGFRIGLEEENSSAHFEWLAPMGTYIDGGMYDFDWNINDPRDNPARLDSLSRSSGRWAEGQMLDLGYEFRLLKRPFGAPLDVWPLIGLRWQRFNIWDYAAVQLIPPDGPFQPPFDGDMITFKQEYCIGYVGAQCRGRWESRILPPIAFTLQGDWGYTQADNVDHHLYYEYFGTHRYTMEDTHGTCWHVALSAEALFCRDRLSIGCQVEHLQIDTRGSHHWLQYGGMYQPADETWTNGVLVSSRQFWLTAFVRLRI